MLVLFVSMFGWKKKQKKSRKAGCCTNLTIPKGPLVPPEKGFNLPLETSKNQPKVPSKEVFGPLVFVFYLIVPY